MATFYNPPFTRLLFESRELIPRSKNLNDISLFLSVHIQMFSIRFELNIDISLSVEKKVAGSGAYFFFQFVDIDAYYVEMSITPSLRDVNK